MSPDERREVWIRLWERWADAIRSGNRSEVARLASLRRRLSQKDATFTEAEQEELKWKAA